MYRRAAVYSARRKSERKLLLREAHYTSLLIMNRETLRPQAL